MNYYALSEFFYHHNGDADWLIDPRSDEVLHLFADKSEAYRVWALHERDVLADIARTDYQLSADEVAAVLEFVAQKTGQTFTNMDDYRHYCQANPSFHQALAALGDADLLTLLQLKKGNRYLITPVSQDVLMQPFYTIDIYDSQTDEYQPYQESARFSENTKAFKLDDKDDLFNADKFNGTANMGYHIYDNDIFYFDDLDDADKANARLQAILDNYSDVFKVDWDKGSLQFIHEDRHHSYRQDEIDALHQVNEQLTRPIFKISEHRLADLL